MKKTEKEEANLQKKDKNLEKTNEKNKEKIMEIIKKAKKEGKITYGELGLGKERTINIFKYLCQNTDKYQIVAISGKNQKMKNSFENFVTEKNANDIKIFEYTDKIPELMHISSLVITKPGGLTSSESLASRSTYYSY